MKNQKKILIISSVWLEPNSSAAGMRMLQLIEFFLSKNYLISYASTAHKSDFSTDLSKLGIEQTLVEINNSNFDQFIQNKNPDIVIFDRFMIEEQFGWRVSKVLPNTIKILDTEDLHCLRKTRELAYKKNKPFNEKILLESDIAKREIASILRCDLSLIISEYEMKLLNNVFKIPNHILLYIPFLLEKSSYNKLKKTPKYNQRKNFYFIGNNLHQPNVAAILELKRLWKNIAKKLPETELHIYGAYPKQQILQLHNEKERFLVKGRLQNIADLQNFRILLAPIPFGAGLKGKFIEAMQYGIPSITNKIGAEGISKNTDWPGFIIDGDIEFIDKSVKIYKDEQIWNNAQKKGVELLNSMFLKHQFLTTFEKEIKKIESNLKTHRTQNFIGQLLLHHTMNSTKYLSKWIEEKNK
jgi:glycosyltransferase involved in cell wall biosynthesis